jgi:hypothetical protein
MELIGKFSREGDRWVYSCRLFRGEGETPEQAYNAYLSVFDYRGPLLPIGEKVSEKKGD